jgi:FdrA protein
MKDKIQELFDSRLVVVNVGPKLFKEALEKQDTEVIQVNWKPAAGGDKQMQDILDLLGGI